MKKNPKPQYVECKSVNNEMLRLEERNKGEDQTLQERREIQTGSVCRVRWTFFL